MLLERVPGNCAEDFISLMSVTRVHVLTKICTYASPPSIAGVSDWIVSVVTGKIILVQDIQSWIRRLVMLLEEGIEMQPCILCNCFKSLLDEVSW